MVGSQEEKDYIILPCAASLFCFLMSCQSEHNNQQSWCVSSKQGREISPWQRRFQSVTLICKTSGFTALLAASPWKEEGWWVCSEEQELRLLICFLRAAFPLKIPLELLAAFPTANLASFCQRNPSWRREQWAEVEAGIWVFHPVIVPGLHPSCFPVWSSLWSWLNCWVVKKCEAHLTDHFPSLTGALFSACKGSVEPWKLSLD